MPIDCCRFAGVKRFENLFPFMPNDWRHHFDRYEWTGAVDLASNHIRVSDRFSHEPLSVFDPMSLDMEALVLPHQGLIVNGWSDLIAAGVFLDALNDYALEHWASQKSRVVHVVNPHDPAGSAERIGRCAGDRRIAAITIPLMPTMLGSVSWDPVFRAATEAGLPVVIHFSGVEGSYAGAPPLAGAPHTNPLSRHILMPHLAESNIASMIFEGAFYRFPTLQVLFAGFGFKWLPSLLRRLDQEWRNFRSDMPWVKDKPSAKAVDHIWASTYPVGEAHNPEIWLGEFSEPLLRRVVFASNAPFDGDPFTQVIDTLGQEWAQRLADNGSAFAHPALRREVAA